MNSWYADDQNRYELGPTTSYVGELPVGIYEFKPTSYGFYLQFVGNKFKFDTQIFDFEDKVIQRIIKSYKEAPQSSQGVLFQGLPGTGKTVAVKRICNQLDVPVIVITKGNSELYKFLEKIDFDCVLFFDEFEKVVPKEAHTILFPIMDGATKKTGRILWMLTVNDNNLSQPMINRPGRIKYIKQFTEPGDVVKQYIASNLKDQTRCTEVEKFFNSRKMRSMDVLRSIVEELNLFGGNIEDLAKMLNITQQ